MSLLFFDCFSGISGDMIIGALLDLGLSFEMLEDALEKLSLPMNISCTRKVDKGLSGLVFTVTPLEVAPIRHLSHIKKLINNSSLDTSIKDRSLEVFQRLAEAEGSVHGISPDEVHFHELGAVDTIVDVVGTFICLDALCVDEIYSSPIPWNGGWIDISHGRYPLPAPATSQLLTGFPCVFALSDLELVTPTGAALISSIARPVFPSLPFVPNKVGYGAGNLVRSDGVPNLLRAILAESTLNRSSLGEVAILETEVDDLNPEIFSHLHNLIVKHPCVYDFFTTPISMKKNRPGVLITVITTPQSVGALINLLMRETGTLGVRYRTQSRIAISREIVQIETPWGPARVKCVKTDGGTIRLKPEFEDCRAIALKHNLPLVDILKEIDQLASEVLIKKVSRET